MTETISRVSKWLKGYDYKLKYGWWEKLISWFFWVVFISTGMMVILNSHDTQVVIAFGTICLFSGLMNFVSEVGICKRRIKELMEKEPKE